MVAVATVLIATMRHGCAGAVIRGGARLPVELEHTITLTPSDGEAPFAKSTRQALCVLTSAGGYALGLPTAQPVNASSDPAHPVPDGGDLRKNLMSGLLLINASVEETTNVVTCKIPR